MSKGEQNIGFNRFKLVTIGKQYQVNWEIPGRALADLASVQYILADKDPEVDSTAAILVTKTVGSGIVLTGSNDNVYALVTVDGADTTGLAQGSYFHRLDYVTTGGALHENGRGAVKAVRRV